MYAAAQAIAAQLVDQGDQLRAYVDPDVAAQNLPCVLVPPPTINFATKAATWNLVVLSRHDTATDACFRDLDATVAKVAQVLDIEGGRPSSYLLQRDKPARPAYLLQFTTSHRKAQS